MRKKIYSFLSYCYAAWWGITIKPQCLFSGIPLFRRHPESSILIESGCRFNSVVWSNLIGINHRCIISTIAPYAKIQIGQGCGFSGVSIGAAKEIILGNRVRCGANVVITDTDWHADDPRAGKSAHVSIEDDVWLGINTIVLKGVTIGARTLVGAHSVVTSNLPPDVVAAGNPARILRQL